MTSVSHARENIGIADTTFREHSAVSVCGRLDSRTLLLAALFWLICGMALPILILTGTSTVGWDLHVYGNANRSLKAGHDPYLDGIAVQRAFHTTPAAKDPGIAPPYTYVYSPLTLPMLRAGSHVPPAAARWLYWIVYAAGLLAIVWAGWQLAEPAERRVFALLAPMAAFFPGLLQTNVILSGNLAYPLYGLMLATAVRGWRLGRWLPFYIAVLAASCFKAPLLSLLLIAVLSARRQWFPAAATGLSGIAIFAIQPVLWPAAFHNYLEAIALQFSFNHDFGFSPSGLLGDTLFYFGLPYSIAPVTLYCVVAACVLATLLLLRRRFLAGSLTLEQWAPLMLVGVILMNPRIKEYDVAPLTLPMAMVTWRTFARHAVFKRALAGVAFLVVGLNVIISLDPMLWKPVEGALLVLLFAAGAWQLARDSPPSGATSPAVQREFSPPTSAEVSMHPRQRKAEAAVRP